MNTEEIFAAEAKQLRQGMQEWASEGRLPPERSAALASLVHRTMAGSSEARQPVERKRRVRWLPGVAAVMAAVLLLPVVSPAARVWATTTFPSLARFIGLKSQVEQGWAWAEEHGAFQEILAVAGDRGNTFRVHRVLADPTQTTIIYSVEGPDPQSPNFWAGERDAIRFNGREFVSHWGGDGRMIDGVFVGEIEVDPLPDENGTMTVVLQQIGDLKGRWQVSFPVTRAPLSELARIIPVYQDMDLGGEQVQVREVEIVPTQTVVHLRYQGPIPAPEISAQMVELHTSSGEVNVRGASGDGEYDREGNGAYDYRLSFQPLPAGTTEVTLRIRAVDTVRRDQRLSLPLKPGATAGVADLPQVTVLEVDDKRAVIQWPYDFDAVKPYEAWWVIDDQGEAHRAGRSGGTGNTTTAANGQVQASPGQGQASIMTLNVTWDNLPRGRQPVALQARQVGQRIEGNWELRIPLN